MQKKVFVCVFFAAIRVFNLCATGETEAGAGLPAKEVTMVAWDRGIIESEFGDISDNWFVRWINENTVPMGFTTKVMPIPNTDRETKTSVMLAAGSAPDIIMSYSFSTLSQYVEQGGIYDYTDLLEQEGRYIPKACTTADLKAGRIAGRQISFRRLANNFADATFIRKDWLDALGMKEPATVDELYAVIKAFMDRDPGEVGENLIPFALSQSYSPWYRSMMQGFVDREINPVEMLLEPKIWPEAKETHRFLNKLWNEGLLGNFWLDKEDQQLKQAIIRGEVGVLIQMAHFLYKPDYGDLLAKLQENDPDADYLIIYPWKKNAGARQYYQLFKSGPYGFFLYSPSTIKNPTETFRLLDFMFSDDFMMATQFGNREGVTYSMDGGYPIRLEGYIREAAWANACFPHGREAWNDNGPRYLEFTAAAFTKEAFKREFVAEVVATTDMPLTTPVVTWNTPVRNKYVGKIDRVFDQKAKEAVIATPQEFDAIWDAAYEEYMANGGAEVKQEVLDSYAEAYGE